MQTPKAKKQAEQLIMHDHVRIDPYYWLREKENPEVIAYLEAENAYCEQETKHTQDLQESLYQEFLSRIEEADETVPTRKGDYDYYSRTEEGKPYRIYCRKKEDAEEILLDLNKEAQNYDFLELGFLKTSPNQKLMAFSLDTTGYEDYTVYIKNLETGELLSDQIKSTDYSLEWANDNQTLFYTQTDSVQRPYKVYKHVLGQKEDEELYHETDERYRVSLQKSKDQRYIKRRSSSAESAEFAFLDADQPEAMFSLIQEREEGLRYSAEHHEGQLYILTNKDDAFNHKLMVTAFEKPNKESWQELIAHDPERTLASLHAFKDYLVIYERAKGLPEVRIRDLRSQEEHYIDFPEEAYSCYAALNPESDTDVFRFEYSSFTTPESTFDYNMRSKKLELKKQFMPEGFVASDYEINRLCAKAKDGRLVPMTMVYRKDLKDQAGCFLYGYGSYGITIDTAFSPRLISLLDRGVKVVFAHVRGGGLMGRKWYEEGKYLAKKNTFTDFIACAEHLIAEEYTRADQLAISGRSAGGLLMGAVLNLAPNLFQVAILGVPFVDVVTTMLDASIPLTVNEYEEWGNPNDETYYNYMLSYSPYDQLEARAYPHILVTAGLNDPRVHYWEPAKWTAKLRELKTDDHALVLKTNMGAGHGGSSDRYSYLREYAFEYAFLLDKLGISS